jgi:hypothetical protein
VNVQEGDWIIPAYDEVHLLPDDVPIAPQDDCKL